MSLGRAFLAAGSSSVTVSLWQISDESTAVMMQEYYPHLLKGQPDEFKMTPVPSIVSETLKRYFIRDLRTQVFANRPWTGRRSRPQFLIDGGGLHAWNSDGPEKL